VPDFCKPSQVAVWHRLSGVASGLECGRGCYVDARRPHPEPLRSRKNDIHRLAARICHFSPSEYVKELTALRSLERPSRIYTWHVPTRDLRYCHKFIWGDYICLSYTWVDCEGEKATIFLDGVATSVLEAALRDLRSSFECQLGMKVSADALCINQVDIVDRNKHVLRVKDIFGEAFSVIAWTKESEDLQVLGLQPPGE
jgi:hypothetical protein